MRHAVCYVSNIAGEMQITELNQLLKFCEEKNKKLDIKGVLLYSGGNFFQVLEGEREVVLPLWAKIQNDPRHSGIIQILGRNIEKGSYDNYIAEILPQDKKFEPGLPPEYTETLKGMSPNVQRIIERMMENFILTR